MTVRKSERPTPGRLGKSTPGLAKTPALGRHTPPTKNASRPSKRPAAEPAGGKNFAATWPLFGDAIAPAFPAHPATTVHQLAPPSADLAALAGHASPPSETAKEADRQRRRFASALAGDAPEWMRAASSLAEWLDERIESGSVEPHEQAAIARTWAAFCLGGTTEPQILRVAHIVQRAHTAIRESPRGHQDLQAAFHAAAGVLHSGLPAVIKQRMPFERVVYVVRRLREEADAWTAIVQGTTELLGWTDYARVHAATAIRAVLERSRPR
ncbi:MAG TPA: hypothetical protein VMI54_03370 [Polyangiaceae bacterium]|nr:hypothetical protein [Polyangiaceae bacterium]